MTLREFEFAGTTGHDLVEVRAAIFPDSERETGARVPAGRAQRVSAAGRARVPPDLKAVAEPAGDAVAETMQLDRARGFRTNTAGKDPAAPAPTRRATATAHPRWLPIESSAYLP